VGCVRIGARSLGQEDKFDAVESKQGLTKLFELPGELRNSICPNSYPGDLGSAWMNLNWYTQLNLNTSWWENSRSVEDMSVCTKQNDFPAIC
jgi:hypothetical protein